jgi:peptidoglycan/LPS O-acetylase OafA/YrhL
LEAFAEKLLMKGALGVSIFFSLSGFIISLPFLAHYISGAKKVHLGSFYIRRLTRLEPPYIISLLILAGIRLATHQYDLRTLLSSLGASLLYQHNQIFGMNSLVSSVTWSLEIEFQFYFLAPMILMIFVCGDKFLRRLILVSLAIVILVLRPESWRWEHSLVGKFEYFVSGILIADFYLTEWKASLPRRTLWDMVAIMGWILFAFAAWRDPSKSVDAFRALAIMIAVTGTLGGKYFSMPFRNPWVAALGGMCYTAYLYHSALLDITCRLFSRFPLSGSYFAAYFVLFVITIPVVFIICSVLFLLFEKPFMRRDWVQIFLSKVTTILRPR